ncbi:hypothetical protein, partial [Parageobacillus toebii]|uniref:hypothetical protein n=1 Tax=Parageobacillus toebii TaxID=153151 RepID=UPI0035B54B91
LAYLSFGTDTEGVKSPPLFLFSYCLASAPSSLVPNNLPPRSASTSAGEEHLASRADRGASAFLCGRFVLFSFQRTFVLFFKSDSYNLSLLTQHVNIFFIFFAASKQLY